MHNTTHRYKAHYSYNATSSLSPSGALFLRLPVGCSMDPAAEECQQGLRSTCIFKIVLVTLPAIRRSGSIARGFDAYKSESFEGHSSPGADRSNWGFKFKFVNGGLPKAITSAAGLSLMPAYLIS